MSWKHSAWASSQIAGSPINKLVLMMMADATSHDNPLLVLKIKTLASKCEASESSVKRAIAELEHRRLVARVSRFFENNQQANGYILVHDEMYPGNLSSIVKSFNTGGCNHVLRAFHWGHGFMEGEYDPVISTPLGSQRTQGGVCVDPPGAQSDLPNNTEFPSPSSSEPIPQQNDQQAAPAPSSPEKSHTKSKAQTGMERELSLKEKLVDVWNASCTQAKAKTGRCLPSCRVFPAGALPSLKTYMRIYSDDEILHLVTDGAFKVQRSDWYHARKYSLTNLMRNLEANASLPAPAKVAPAMTETPTDLSSFLTSPDRAKNEEEVPEAGRGTILATNPDDIWDLP